MARGMLPEENLENHLLSHCYVPLTNILEFELPIKMRMTDTESCAVSAVFSGTRHRFDGVGALRILGIETMFIEAKKANTPSQTGPDKNKLEKGRVASLVHQFRRLSTCPSGQVKVPSAETSRELRSFSIQFANKKSAWFECRPFFWTLFLSDLRSNSFSFFFLFSFLSLFVELTGAIYQSQWMATGVILMIRLADFIIPGSTVEVQKLTAIGLTMIRLARRMKYYGAQLEHNLSAPMDTKSLR